MEEYFSSKPSPAVTVFKAPSITMQEYRTVTGRVGAINRRKHRKEGIEHITPVQLSDAAVIPSATPFKLAIRNASYNMNGSKRDLYFYPKTGALPEVRGIEGGDNSGAGPTPPLSLLEEELYHVKKEEEGTTAPPDEGPHTKRRLTVEERRQRLLDKELNDINQAAQIGHDLGGVAGGALGSTAGGVLGAEGGPVGSFAGEAIGGAVGSAVGGVVGEGLGYAVGGVKAGVELAGFELENILEDIIGEETVDAIATALTGRTDEQRHPEDYVDEQGQTSQAVGSSSGTSDVTTTAKDAVRKGANAVQVLGNVGSAIAGATGHPNASKVLNSIGHAGAVVRAAADNPSTSSIAGAVGAVSSAARKASGAYANRGSSGGGGSGGGGGGGLSGDADLTDLDFDSGRFEELHEVTDSEQALRDAQDDSFIRQIEEADDDLYGTNSSGANTVKALLPDDKKTQTTSGTSRRPSTFNADDDVPMTSLDFPDVPKTKLPPHPSSGRLPAMPNVPTKPPRRTSTDSSFSLNELGSETTTDSSSGSAYGSITQKDRRIGGAKGIPTPPSSAGSRRASTGSNSSITQSGTGTGTGNAAPDGGVIGIRGDDRGFGSLSELLQQQSDRMGRARDGLLRDLTQSQEIPGFGDEPGIVVPRRNVSNNPGAIHDALYQRAVLRAQAYETDSGEGSSVGGPPGSSGSSSARSNDSWEPRIRHNNGRQDRNLVTVADSANGSSTGELDYQSNLIGMEHERREATIAEQRAAEARRDAAERVEREALQRDIQAGIRDTFGRSIGDMGPFVDDAGLFVQPSRVIDPISQDTSVDARVINSAGGGGADQVGIPTVARRQYNTADRVISRQPILTEPRRPGAVQRQPPGQPANTAGVEPAPQEWPAVIVRPTPQTRPEPQSSPRTGYPSIPDLAPPPVDVPQSARARKAINLSTSSRNPSPPKKKRQNQDDIISKQPVLETPRRAGAMQRTQPAGPSATTKKTTKTTKTTKTKKKTADDYIMEQPILTTDRRGKPKETPEAKPVAGKVRPRIDTSMTDSASASTRKPTKKRTTEDEKIAQQPTIETPRRAGAVQRRLPSPPLPPPPSTPAQEPEQTGRRTRPGTQADTAARRERDEGLQRLVDTIAGEINFPVEQITAAQRRTFGNYRTYEPDGHNTRFRNNVRNALEKTPGKRREE
jgi:hypothetical protein